jgi:hypothetical protein
VLAESEEKLAQAAVELGSGSLAPAKALELYTGTALKEQVKERKVCSHGGTTVLEFPDAS